MAISQTTVVGSFRTPANTDARVMAVIFRLIGSDFENGESITVNSVPAIVDPENGDFEITVWPNDKGSRGGTSYNVTYIFDDASVVTGLSNVIVRYSPDPWTLEDLDFQMRASSQLAQRQIREMTAAQFSAPGFQPDPNTVYLIIG